MLVVLEERSRSRSHYAYVRLAVCGADLWSRGLVMIWKRFFDNWRLEDLMNVCAVCDLCFAYNGLRTQLFWRCCYGMFHIVCCIEPLKLPRTLRVEKAGTWGR